MILFMLQVGTKPFYIDINGMFQGSLETALSVRNISACRNILQRDTFRLVHEGGFPFRYRC